MNKFALPITTLYKIAGSFTDNRDGKTYKTIKIGNQIWMAENLNFATSSDQISILSENWCYEGKVTNCTRYGRLYVWKSAINVCPVNWHLPTITDWNTLIDYLGGDVLAGDKLKSQTGWNETFTEATNKSRFSALPGGWGAPTIPGNLGNIGIW